MSLVPGQKFYEYDIIRRIGKGGFGAIYEARDTLLDRRVAIKELLLSHAEDEITLQRFIQEARTAGGIDHPAIVTVYGLKKVEDDYYLIMEFVGGGSLRTLMQDQGKLPIEKAVDIVISVCEGLAAVHEKGIVHRDIKPDNILLTEDGRIRISDFGSAHVPRQSSGHPALTRTGFHPGTFIYMSPEQALGRSIDRRSDLYNVGVLLYELLTGRFYLQHTEAGGQSGIRLDSLLTSKTPVVPPTVYEPTIPPALEQTIMKCLSRDPDDRFQTAREIIEALRAATAQGLRLTPLPGAGDSRLPGADRSPVHRGLAQAFAALEQDRLDEAHEAFSSLLSHDPHSAEAHFGMAAMYSRQRQYEQAIPVFQRAIELRPDYSEALMGLAWAHKQASAYRAAIDIYNQVLRRDPSHAWAYFHLADTYKTLGKLDQAFSAFQEANTHVRDDLENASSCQLLIELAEAYKSLDMSTHATIALQRAVRIKPEHVLDFYSEDVHRGDDTIYRQLVVGLQQAIKANPHRAALYYNLGRAYAWGPEPERAIAELEHAISTDPEYVDAHLALADVYRRLGQTDLALEKYQDVIHLAPRRPEAFCGMGSIYAAQDKIGKAIAAFQQAIDLKPDYTEAYTELVEALKRVLQREPRRAEIHFYLGLAYAGQGDMWRAASAFQQTLRLKPDAREAHDNLVATLEQLVESNPYDAEVHYHLGMTYASAGEWGKAVAAFLRATELAPDDNEIRGDLMAALEQAVKIGTKNAEVHYRLGTLYMGQGYLNQALPCFEEAVRLDQSHLEAHTALAEIYQQMGRIQDAIREYSVALELQPRDARVHFNLAVAYESQNRLYETARALERAITFNPNHVMAHHRLGNLYYIQERLDDAAREYLEVIHLQRDHVEAHFQLGMVYFRRQRFDLATNEFEEVIRVDADHLRAHDMLAQARLWLGVSTPGSPVGGR